MPTNLPQEAVEVEKRYRAAKWPAERIACLKESLGTSPKHKGTDKLRADSRRRLSKLKAAAQARKSVSRQDSAFRIDKEGAAQVVVVGPANVGESALVATLTNASPEVAGFSFGAGTPTPAMVPMENIQVQLVDTKPLNRDLAEPELVDLIRRSDLILLVVDLQTYRIQQLEDTMAFLQGHRIVPHRLKDHHTEQRDLTFKPILVLANKSDDEDSDEDFEISCELLEDDWPLLRFSATGGRNLERLEQVAFEREAPQRSLGGDPPRFLRKTKNGQSVGQCRM